MKDCWLVICRTKTDEFISAFDTESEARAEAEKGEEVCRLSDFDEYMQENILNSGISYDRRKNTK